MTVLLGNVHPVILDVTDPATIRAAAAQVASRFGRLDVLVNNAGISGGRCGLQTPGTVSLDVARADYPVSKTALNALTVQYAKACTTAQGAEIAVRLATIGPGGPTGGFFDDDGPVPW